jgi:omega-amidase
LRFCHHQLTHSFLRRGLAVTDFTLVTQNTSKLSIVLGEYDTRWHDPVASIAAARELARQGRATDADLLVLPEMCTTGFTMDVEHFAEPPDGPSVRALSKIAAENKLWIIAGISMSRDGKYLNCAVAFAPDGSIAATYDKQRLFGYAKETEIYSAGDKPCIIEINGVSLALFVCFDLRFPELFREVGPKADAFVVIANWPNTRQKHWEVLTHARAIENQCFVVAVNRTGEADGLVYEGGSMLLDPWGERRDLPVPGSSLRIGEISEEAVAEVRKVFPLTHATAR